MIGFIYIYIFVFVRISNLFYREYAVIISFFFCFNMILSYYNHESWHNNTYSRKSLNNSSTKLNLLYFCTYICIFFRSTRTYFLGYLKEIRIVLTILIKLYKCVINIIEALNTMPYTIYRYVKLICTLRENNI